MQIALYKGKSLVSYAIRWVTRSPYSHAAFVFDVAAEAAGERLARAGVDFGKLQWRWEGSVVEAWRGGVKNSPSIGTLHRRGTPVDIFSFSPALRRAEEEHLVEGLVPEIGLPYDYRDVLRFLTRSHGQPGHTRFCSLLVAHLSGQTGRPLFHRTEAWRVPPDWLGRSLGLRFVETRVTR
jgi:hypothetical protein